MQYYGFQPDFVLKAALDQFSSARYADARTIAATHKNALVPALMDWLIARRPDSGMSAPDIISILTTHRGWPEAELLQLRAEQAFHALGPKGDSVLAFYNQVEPITVGGRMAFAGALREAGACRGGECARPRAMARLVAELQPGGDALRPLRQCVDEG